MLLYPLSSKKLYILQLGLLASFHQSCPHPIGTTISFLNLNFLLFKIKILSIHTYVFTEKIKGGLSYRALITHCLALSYNDKWNYTTRITYMSL